MDRQADEMNMKLIIVFGVCVVVLGSMRLLWVGECVRAIEIFFSRSFFFFSLSFFALFCVFFFADADILNRKKESCLCGTYFTEISRKL